MELVLDTTDMKCPVLKVSGTIVIKDVDKFDATLQSIVTAPGTEKLLVDITKLENWDDGGIASLLSFIKDWNKEDKSLAIFGMAESLIADLDRKGMLMLFPLFKTEEEARVSI